LTLAVVSNADTLAEGEWSMSSDLRPTQTGLASLFETLLEYLSTIEPKSCNRINSVTYVHQDFAILVKKL
jgi:hypothetical protein